MMFVGVPFGANMPAQILTSKSRPACFAVGTSGNDCETLPGKVAARAVQEVFRPTIVQVLRDPLAAAQLGNAGRIMLARRPSDVLDNLLSRLLQWSGLLSHLRSYERYDEPETLPYSIRPSVQ